MGGIGNRASAKLVESVKHLLNSGWRQKQVAEHCGISVRTVEKISNGTITGRPKVSGGHVPPNINRVRCRECGGLLYETPCRACALRRAMGV